MEILSNLSKKNLNVWIQMLQIHFYIIQILPKWNQLLENLFDWIINSTGVIGAFIGYILINKVQDY